jgi:hypothetical protein
MRHATKSLSRRRLLALPMCPAPFSLSPFMLGYTLLTNHDTSAGEVWDQKGEEGFSAVALSALFAL